MSLVQSARLNGHEPWAYLCDVLARLPTQLNSRIDELLSHSWQRQPPAAWRPLPIDVRLLHERGLFFPNDEARPDAPRITSATELGHYRRPEATRLIALINRAIDAGLHHDQLGGRVDEDAVAVSTKKNKLAP